MTANKLLDRSPRTKARIAGLFYLLTIVFGASALFGAGWLRSAMLLGSTLCYVAVTALFYSLFRAVNRNISTCAALLSLVGCALSILDLLHLDPFRMNPLGFFGCYCLLIGYLILRSKFLPRILGALMAFGGLGWLTFAYPPLASYLSPYNMAPGILGEAALTVWLLAFGVNEQRWNEQATAAA
jgi:hypothetical protein